jgi:5-methylcytosine-specific restriction endonuclease McrA
MTAVAGVTAYGSSILAGDPECRIQVKCGPKAGQLPALSTEVDHIVPTSRGGDESLESLDNLRGACYACNAYKTAAEDSTFTSSLQ